MSRKGNRDLRKQAIREKQKEDGFFDGRFKTRSTRNKSKYTRKEKYPNEFEEDGD